MDIVGSGAGSARRMRSSSRIGALGSDAGGATSGGAAGGSPNGSGVGGAVANGGTLQVAGGSGGCGILCLILSAVRWKHGKLSQHQQLWEWTDRHGEYCDDGNTLNGDGCTGCIIDPGWQCPLPGQTCMPPPPGIDAGIPQPRFDAGVPVLPVHDAGPAATGPLSQGPTSWTGYIENYQFPSGSDVIRFTSTVDSSGQVMVTVFLGNGTPPPPATDPNVGYPPGLATEGMMLDSASNYWSEGFAYSMTSGTFQPQRLRFTINNYQLWSGWCALQKPIDDSGMCLPAWGGGSGTSDGTNCSATCRIPPMGTQLLSTARSTTCVTCLTSARARHSLCLKPK